MIHSTNVGDKCWMEFGPSFEDASPSGVAGSGWKRWEIASSSCPRRCPGFAEPLKSFAPGVGQSRPVESPVATRSDRLTPAWACEFSVFRLPEAFASPAVGVGQLRAHVSRLGVPRVGRSCGTVPSFWLLP